MSALKYLATIERKSEQVCVFTNGAPPGAYCHQRVELRPEDIQTILDFRHPAPFTADLPNPKYGELLKYHADPVLLESIPTEELMKAIGLKGPPPQPAWTRSLELAL